MRSGERWRCDCWPVAAALLSAGKGKAEKIKGAGAAVLIRGRKKKIKVAACLHLD
jgi:hypothetical protein